MKRVLDPMMIAEDRVQRWDAYLSTLDSDARHELERLTHWLRDEIQERGGRNFGSRSAKELIMALFEYQSRHTVRQSS